MKKFTFLLTFLVCSFSYSQSDKKIDSIVINSTKFGEQVDYRFSYLITSDKTITPKKLIASNHLKKDYCNCVASEAKNHLKYLWLLGKVVNRTKDTLDLVLYSGDMPILDAYIISKQNYLHKQLGYIQKSEERFCAEIPNCFPLKLAPNEEIKIIFHQKIINKDNIISKLNLLTKDKYNEVMVNLYKEYHKSRMIFGILLGGILIVLGYNLLLYIKTRSKNYLYYSLYLLCSFLYIFIIMDRNQNFFLGEIMLFLEILKEITYTLSFILYGYFIISIVDTKIFVRKTVRIYSILAFVYILFLAFTFHKNNYDFTLFDLKIILIFKYISFVYLAIVLIELSKKKNKKHVKYIFIGSLILFCSYLLQFIFFNFSTFLNGSLFFKIVVRNNFIILLGTILEVSFFTYAIYLQSSQIVKEKNHLENLGQIKSRFFANISHEFRTPLTLIKSPLQSLQSEIIDENQLKKLALIAVNSSRMLELVDQLLQLSKIDNGILKLILKDGTISSFLNLIIEKFEFEAKQNAILFSSNIEKSTSNHLFDRDVIEKIVTNLISNAFKYSTVNALITFSSKEENSYLKIIVSNTGSDLKKEDLPKLFERFYQMNDSNQGVGIGLALVKELVDLCKGRIEAKLENDKLSFIVALPLTILNENAVVIQSKNNEEYIENLIDKDSELPILLIVDDNAEIRNVLKDIFKDDYKILEAKNGEIALKIAQKEIPDCIISDVMMPKMDGFEFTKNIKNNELTSFIPIILLTAKTSDEAHIEGLKSNADAFLTKPFNNEIIKSTVNQLINERKKLHQRYSQELVLFPVDIVINSLDEKFIQKLQIILDANLSNSEFTVEKFASEISMSRMQLHRKLKSLLGVTSTEFLRNERLKVAAELLKKGNGNISEIAYGVGFNDVSYFSKCFKEMYRYTPTEYSENK